MECRQGRSKRSNNSSVSDEEGRMRGRRAISRPHSAALRRMQAWLLGQLARAWVWGSTAGLGWAGLAEPARNRP